MLLEITDARHVVALRNTTDGRDAVHIQVLLPQGVGRYCVKTFWGRYGTRLQSKVTLSDANRLRGLAFIDAIQRKKVRKGYQVQSADDFVISTLPDAPMTTPIEAVRSDWGLDHGGGGLF